MYLKRSKIPKTWPLPRKGKKYIVRPLHNLRNSIPLLIILRDVLKLVGTRKEVKKILSSGKIKVNGKVVRDERFPLTLFDNLNLDNKNFKLVYKNKKFDIVKIKDKEAEEKIAKVIGKKILKGNRMQVNLSDGRNYILKEKVKVGDSIIIDLKENKISKILPFKEGCKIMFISGKHVGEVGEVEAIDEKRKIIILKVGDEKINSKIDNLMVIK